MAEYLQDEETGTKIHNVVISTEELTRLAKVCRTPEALAAESQAKPNRPITITVRYTPDPDVRVYTLPMMLLETPPAVMIRYHEPIEGGNLTPNGRTLGRLLADEVEGANYVLLTGRFAFQIDLCPSFEWDDAHEQIMGILKEMLAGLNPDDIYILEIDFDLLAAGGDGESPKDGKDSKDPGELSGEADEGGEAAAA